MNSQLPRLSCFERLGITADKDSFVEINENLNALNVMDFPDYEKKIAELQKKFGIKDAVVTGICSIKGYKTVLCIMDSRFLMGSMGCVVGEKIARAFEYGQNNKLPVIIFSASGGARMQEGIFSLMQMAKTAAAVGSFGKAGGFFISVLTDPTSGGVTASFAMLGDIIIAEPDAMIGFAGRRVIQDTMGSELPEGFQSAEYIVEHGFIDIICERDDLRSLLAKILCLHSKNELSKNVESDLAKLKTQINYQTKQKSTLTVQEKLRLLRSLTRPGILDFLPLVFDDWIPLRGDRLYGDDPAVIGGLAALGEIPVTVIAQVRARNIDEFKKINFSMPRPEGYRKALRLAKQAEKFHRPVICFIDTPGAYCGVEAEERGQAEAIASCLTEFAELKTPVISIVLGIGGSGGALALAVGDELAMLENSILFVISPKGFASILWKDPAKEKDAAEIMKISAKELYEFGVCQHIIEEASTEITAHNIQTYICAVLDRLVHIPADKLVESRHQKYRSLGHYLE